MPAYGRSFTLSGNSVTPGSAAAGPGSQGPHTGESGFLGYYEICQNIQSGWTEVYDDELKSMYSYNQGYQISRQYLISPIF